LIDTGCLLGKVIQLAVKNDLSISCAHTNFDHAEGGTNLALAKAIGLKSPRPLFSKGDRGGGIVYLGELPRPTKLSEFSIAVKESLGAPMVRFVGDGNFSVSLVAVSGGSGSDYIIDAAKAGAQAFVTGEVKYHTALSAVDYGIGIVEAGHFYTETPAVFEMENIIREETSKKGWDVDIFTIGGKDPFSII
jgi:dinuclear metal center YbgI/SA1388 family protein